MILRIRQPDGTNRDTPNVPASARTSGYVAGASRYGYLAGERAVPLPEPNLHALAQRRYRERKAAAA